MLSAYESKQQLRAQISTVDAEIACLRSELSNATTNKRDNPDSPPRENKTKKRRAIHCPPRLATTRRTHLCRRRRPCRPRQCGGGRPVERPPPVRCSSLPPPGPGRRPHRLIRGPRLRVHVAGSWLSSTVVGRTRCDLRPHPLTPSHATPRHATPPHPTHLHPTHPNPTHPTAAGQNGAGRLGRQDVR